MGRGQAGSPGPPRAQRPRCARGGALGAASGPLCGVGIPGVPESPLGPRPGSGRRPQCWGPATHGDRMLPLAQSRRLGSEPADGRLFLCLPSSSQIVQILPGGLCSPAPPQPPPQGPRRAALPTHEAESPRMPGLTSRHLHEPGAQPQGRGSSDPRVSKVPGRTVSSRWSEPSARHHGSLGSKAPRHEQRISR